jgi:hypothetical protein
MTPAVMTLLFAILWPSQSLSSSAALESLINEDVLYPYPLAPCEAAAVFVWILKVTQVPGGVEELAEECADTPARRGAGDPPRSTVSLTAKTVRQALNELVRAVPRHRWAESQGVIVLRPTRAWMDTNHFLHRTLSSFAIINENLGGALDQWRIAMGDAYARSPSDSMRSAQRTPQGSRRFSVPREPATTAIGALDNIARAHGALYWRINYCQQEVDPRFATVRLRTLEADPTEIGVRLREEQTAGSDRVADPCRQKH